jgi:4-amino-4-deoxy-L-arabinose transferase-like glycosyltransferase
MITRKPGVGDWTWTAWLLLLLNALLAAYVVFILHPMETAIFSDMKGYFLRAEQIAKGHYDLHHFFQPIGYPLWMSFWRELAGGEWVLLKLSHVMLVTLSAFLGWRTARLVVPPKLAIAVLFLLCLHIQWLALASYALSETLFTFFITGLIWSSVRWAVNDQKRDAMLAGMFFGLGFYVKGSAVFFPPVLLVWSLLRAHHQKKSLRNTVGHLAIMGVCALAVALSHGVFSQINYGQFKLGAEAGGLNFVEGKCPEKHNIDNEGAHWLSPLHNYLGETLEKHWDVPFSNQAYYWRQGWECVKSNPAVMLTSVRYIYYLFTGNPLWPVGAREAFYEGWFTVVVLPLLLIGLLTASRHWDQPIFVPALLLLSLFLVVWIFKSELRFRVPFDAIVMIYAVLGARTLWLGLRQTDSLIASPEKIP